MYQCDSPALAMRFILCRLVPLHHFIPPDADHRALFFGRSDGRADLQAAGIAAGGIAQAFALDKCKWAGYLAPEYSVCYPARWWRDAGRPLWA